MLCPIPSGDANCGPFFEDTAMKATIEELVKIVIQGSVTFSTFFKPMTLEDLKIKLSLIKYQNEWFAKFYQKSSFDQLLINGIDKILLKIEENIEMTETEIKKLIDDFNELVKL